MKKMDDDELQKWLDENRLLSNDKPAGLTGDDAKAYQVLFDALDTVPAQGLPYNFSAKVMRHVKAGAMRKNELRYYLVAVAAFAAIVVAVYGLGMLVKPNVRAQYVTILLQYKWAVVLSIFSFLTIQYLDQVLVKVNVLKRYIK